MGIGQITFGGLASGLDTNSIVASLVALERRPIQVLEGQRGDEREKLNLLGTFEGLVKKLQTKAEELTSASGFYAFDLNSSSETLASFTLSDGAQAGSHTLEVESLASADRLAFDPLNQKDNNLGVTQIDFDYESDPDTAGQEHFTITIEPGSGSLEGMAEAINSQAGEFVTASVINVGTTVDPSYQLVVAGNDTGEDYTIDNMTVTGAPQTPNITKVTNASNALVRIDGLDVQRSGNTFSDVVPGVSFTVNEVTGTLGTGTPITFTIDSDPEGIKENLKGFVDAYNEVIDFINAQSEYDPEAGPGGALFGDQALQTVKRTIHGALFFIEDISVVQNDDEGYSTLGLVGIELESDGRLKIDDAKLEEKIGENLAAFADLFIKLDEDGVDPDETGVLRKLDDAIEAMIKDRIATDPDTGEPVLNPVTGKEIQVDGLFNARRGTLNKIIKDIGSQIDRLELDVERFEEGLVLQFARLEEVLGGLNAQSQFLAQGLAFPTA